MENLLRWIKEHKKRMLLILLLIIFLPILIIHILFKVNLGIPWIQAEWEAGELLGYFGDVLSFIGTVVLGYVAICQSEKANQLNNELLQIEKIREKPCLDIQESQVYNIFFGKEMYEKLDKCNELKSLRFDLLYTRNPRTGITTGSVLLVISVTNSGGSEIRRIYLDKIFVYLHVKEPYSNNEVRGWANGVSSLKVGESKKLFIFVKREIEKNEEVGDTWYLDHKDRVMPHIELDLILVTASGKRYKEELKCESGWNRKLKSEKYVETREMYITQIYVQEILD